MAVPPWRVMEAFRKGADFIANGSRLPFEVNAAPEEIVRPTLYREALCNSSCSGPV
jgi:hypothetical protein